ncbi:MAG TPA: ThuA domain-containing protein, partial [Verrucomicrobiota bacterium]|nr:ThuA domain-containing protein [Verrucomicrobiota bacterium]
MNGGPSFGPPHWAGDAFVTGYSRGKLWRTKLAKSAAGYVAKTELFATLQSLAVDVCVSPRGDLIVASHGGRPDWGGGPNGRGHLWRIRHEDRQAPQPVAAWNASPTELAIVFDRPVPADAVKGLAERARIESGASVFPGDRFETIRPGYQVVYDQLAAPRHAHAILGPRLSPDGRQLTLLTRPRTAAVNHVVTLPSLGAEGHTRASTEGGSARPDGRGYDEVDLLTTLHGLEAEWTPAGGGATKLWLPHPDLGVTRAFTAASATHSWTPSGPGALTFRGQLDLFQMLQPAIQPGAAIDWERPPEDVTVTFESSRPFTGGLGGAGVASQPAGGGRHRASVTLRAPGRAWQPLALRIAGDGGPLDFTASWHTPEDPRPRAFPLRRFLLPWAQPAESGAAPAGPREIPELAGGNWQRGRRLFHGDQLACAKCHTIHGEGARVGPDLSNLAQRDYASVRQDIEFPNAALNPDHLASVLELADGETVTGLVLREEGGRLTVVTGSGAEEGIPRAGVKAIRPAAASLMPEGLWNGMTEAQQRDLMTYLLTAPPPPAEVAPELQGHRRPPARARAEFAALLASAAAPPAAPPRPLRVVLCASPKDRGHAAPGFHDYPLWRERWSQLLALGENVIVETADRWPSEAQWQGADVVAFYHDNPAWAADKAGDLDAFLARGGGLVFLHWSLNAYRDTDALKQRIVRAWGAGGKFRHGPLELAFAPHAITAGFPAAARFVDETYWNLPTAADDDATVLATAVEDGVPRPQVWVKEAGPGRVFVCIPGHFTWTFDDPLYRVLLLRGLAWAAGQPVDRFTELATVG